MRYKRLSLVLVLPMFWCLRAESAPSIGIFFDGGCGTCGTILSPGESAPVAVRIVWDGFVSQFPVSGARFAISGLPAAWSMSLTPNPSAHVFGDPLAGGVSLGFTEPIHGSCIELYSGTITAGPSPGGAVLEIVAHPTLSCFSLPSCPCISCEAGGDCGLCAETIPGVVNGDGCLVTARESAWSEIKRVYR